ncbi:hypothetical protein [Pseudotabrizicola algicola]|uniref:Uncharacterized protein n=1 Tax=Pseudotabrizicola algicola TaxID=2709381 RepID=A0A6B3RWR7_9RHOB|nr:hypothetical protein [Pseudotabrizicola algicola]NEX47562.1 hypothetical protein [Pseudotabrizicola algicola]
MQGGKGWDALPSPVILPAMKRLLRALLLLAFAGSLTVTLRAGYQIANTPALRPLIDRSAAEIEAATDRMMAREATPDRLAALIEARLDESPRNWVALTALAEVSEAQGYPLPASYAQAWEEESGLMALSGDCLACMWDINACSLSTALICKAPIFLTPVEDLRGVVKAGADYSLGRPIDQLDLGLSVLGLGATAAFVATGGTSATVKAGTATIRLARGMGRLSPALGARMTGAVTDGIRWADLPMVRSADDAAALLRTDALRPLAETVADLGRMADATGPVPALHLLPLVDDATDARRLANAAEALGPKTVSRAEVLGKSRLLRATLRYGDEAVALIVGLVGALLSFAMLLAGMVQSMVIRRLRARVT